MGILSALFSLGTSLIGWRKEASQANHDLKIAEIEAKKEALSDKTKALSTWELAQLTDKDKGLRWAAFILFASPLIAYWISPKFGIYIQQGWGSIEPWQAEVLKSMSLAVFGYKSVPHILGYTVQSVKKIIKK